MNNTSIENSKPEPLTGPRSLKLLPDMVRFQAYAKVQVEPFDNRKNAARAYDNAAYYLWLSGVFPDRKPPELNYPEEYKNPVNCPPPFRTTRQLLRRMLRPRWRVPRGTLPLALMPDPYLALQQRTEAEQNQIRKEKFCGTPIENLEQLLWPVSTLPEIHP